jgi:hypothetical protein
VGNLDGHKCHDEEAIAAMAQWRWMQSIAIERVNVSHGFSSHTSVLKLLVSVRESVRLKQLVSGAVYSESPPKGRRTRFQNLRPEAGESVFKRVSVKTASPVEQPSPHHPTLGVFSTPI